MKASSPGVRINRFLALSGLGARRAVETLVLAGKVAVNGAVTRDLSLRVTPGDRVTVNGSPVTPRRRMRYYAYYKRRGVLTTTKDPGRRRTIRDELPPGMKTLNPVGRLDGDTEGLIFLTDDGGFAQRVAHPSYEVTKVYYVEAVGNVTGGDAAAFRAGIELKEGGVGRLRTIEIKKLKDVTAVTVSVSYGRKRMIRQMFAARGFKIRTLRRIAIGVVDLGDLNPGEFRELTPQEVAAFLDEWDDDTAPGRGPGRTRRRG